MFISLKSFALRSLLTISAAFLSPQSFAYNISASFGGIAAGGNVYRNIDNRGYRLSGGQMRFNVDKNASVLPNISPETIYGWCIEPFEGISTHGTNDWELTDLKYGTTNIGGMGEARANYLRELYYFVAPDFSQLVTPTVGLALQIATWEIVRDNSVGNYNVYSGNSLFRRSNPSSSLALAQSWLDSYINDGVQGPMLNNVYAANIDGKQDMIFQINTPPTQSNNVPTPAPLALLLTGLALIRLYQTKKASA